MVSLSDTQLHLLHDLWLNLRSRRVCFPNSDEEAYVYRRAIPHVGLPLDNWLPTLILTSQIIFITIAPVFFTAALYLTLSRVITHYGIYNSRLSPKAYTIGFIASDFLALVLQSAGGAIAETANNRATSKAGTNVMVGGLAFQVASLVVFCVLAAEFFWKVKADRKHIRATNWAYGVPEKPAGDIDGLKTFLYGSYWSILSTPSSNLMTTSIHIRDRPHPHTILFSSC